MVRLLEQCSFRRHTIFRRHAIRTGLSEKQIERGAPGECGSGNSGHPHIFSGPVDPVQLPELWTAAAREQQYRDILNHPFMRMMFSKAWPSVTAARAVQNSAVIASEICLECSILLNPNRSAIASEPLSLEGILETEIDQLMAYDGYLGLSTLTKFAQVRLKLGNNLSYTVSERCAKQRAQRLVNEWCPEASD